MPILEQLFAVFTAMLRTRSAAPAATAQRAVATRHRDARVRSACANARKLAIGAWAALARGSLVETNKREMKGEQFSRNRKRLALSLARAAAAPEMKNFLYRELLSSL